MAVSSNVINASLKTDYIGIGEVVALGYTEKGKNEITGSTFQVKGSKIANVPVTSVDQALQGKVPGLVVSAPSGTPGTMQDIRIRGVGSITASNQPLFVIDGVPVINPDFSGEIYRSTFSALSFLNSDDIETITVLKDASATSAYGARGSNGVIVISTKKGGIGETRFGFNTSVGFQNFATDGISMLNGAQREELMLESVHNTFNVPVDEAYNFLIDNKITNSLKTWVETYNRKEGNWDELLLNKNALVQNYDVSASGGDEVSNFYASLGYNNTEATVVGGDFSRISGKFNYQRHFTKKVKFAANMMVSNTKQDAILEQSVYFGSPNSTRYLMSPWEQPYLADGVTLNTATTSSFYNTLYTLENDVYQNDLTRGMINSFIEWEIMDNLIFKTVYAGDYNVAAFHTYQNRVHGDGKPKGGSAIQSVTRNYNWVSQNSLDYKYAVNDHNIGLKALMEYQENNNQFLQGSGEKFPADGLVYLSSASSNLDANAAFTDWKNLSYLGMANYNFSNKYIADVTYRYEGSSLFAPDNRFGNFWSAGVAWNVSEEGFLEEIKNIDILRLRASYGLSGSSAIGINQYQALLGYDRSYANEGAVYPKQIGNPDLSWEKNRNFDVGIDYAFFDGRLKGSAAYYNKNTYDLLQMVPLSRTMGHESMMMNVGSMVNKGFEFVVQGDIIRSSGLNLNIGLNLATVNNEVTALATDASGNEISIENLTRKVAVGHPVYGWYMRKWAGVNPENGNAQWYLNGVDGEVTESYYAAKKEWQGESAIPKLTAGILTHADYKGFYLDLNLYFAGGHKVYEDFSFLTHHTGFYTFSFYNGVDELMNRWQKPGDVTEVPKVWYGTRDDSRESTRFLFEGDYLRVKDLVFGYRIPSKYTGKIGFENMDIYARGTNLFTFVKDDGLMYDPEVGADGMTRFTTPPVKSVVFGINLNF
jgi:TonB-linked SusC/RagA family outer membrane protein